MMWAGETFLFFDEWIDPEETHRKVDAVTSADISEAARVAFDLETLSSALIGPGKSEKVISDWLAGS